MTTAIAPFLQGKLSENLAKLLQPSALVPST